MVVGAGHVGVDVEGTELRAEVVVKGSVAIEPAGVDRDVEPYAHQVTKGLERAHGRGDGLIAHVLFVRPATGGVSEGNDTRGTTALAACKTPLPVADANRGRDHATSVVLGLAACPTHRS